jgi:hypothetical protein
VDKAVASAVHARVLTISIFEENARVSVLEYPELKALVDMPEEAARRETLRHLGVRCVTGAILTTCRLERTFYIKGGTMNFVSVFCSRGLAFKPSTRDCNRASTNTVNLSYKFH